MSKTWGFGNGECYRVPLATADHGIYMPKLVHMVIADDESLNLNRHFLQKVVASSTQTALHHWKHLSASALWPGLSTFKGTTQMLKSCGAANGALRSRLCNVGLCRTAMQDAEACCLLCKNCE